MDKLTFAVAQSIAVPGDLARSVRDHVRLASDAGDRRARIVVFPELSLTGYDRRLTPRDALAPSDPRLQPLQAVADARDLIIIAGAPVVSTDGLHIGALSLIPGRPAQAYLKQYLHGGEEVTFAPGEGGAALRLGDHTISIAICADMTHPEHARAAADRGAGIYAASCFITPGGYDTDAGLLEGYARKHRMVVLLANYGAGTSEWRSAGRSAIWSNDGTLLACGPTEGEAIVHATIDGSGLIAVTA
jgi:predicted amidohydrolase